MYYTKIFKYYGNTNLCHIIDLQSWITAILSALMTDTVLSSSFKHTGQKGGKRKKERKGTTEFSAASYNSKTVQCILLTAYEIYMVVRNRF